MDPNANLKEQSELIAVVLDPVDRRRLSELRRALQQWISSGGFKPDWKAYPDATKAYRAWVSKSAKFADLYR